MAIFLPLGFGYGGFFVGMGAGALSKAGNMLLPRVATNRHVFIAGGVTTVSGFLLLLSSDLRKIESNRHVFTLCAGGALLAFGPTLVCSRMVSNALVNLSRRAYSQKAWKIFE